MERKALGRGLAALISSRAETETTTPVSTTGAGEGRSVIRTVPIDRIRTDSGQPRKTFHPESLKELAASIRAKGILVPLIVSQNGDRYDLISGERRLRASLIAGLAEVPVVIRQAEGSEKLELALIENIHREDLDPIEEASTYSLLMEQFGYTQEGVADRVGRERSTVANLLRLLKLPAKVKEALGAKQISMGHARALLGIPEIERQLYFLTKVISEEWSVRELERKIGSQRGFLRKSRPIPVSLPPHLEGILDGMRRILGTQVKILPAGRKKGKFYGKILIDYYSEDDLDRIHKVIVRSI
ncbi:MAG: ParB/RepB/Spo0J family partition protein [Deltaproteobacteria bacterium]|nr:ParB/RepB/Spo0J family partition protein [Deltaproteobacteria bacterium]